MTHTAKHTPGPWVVKHSGTGDAAVVAECGWVNKDGSPFNHTIVPRIDWATGNLIAAAPAMYEALQQSLALVELAALEEWGRAVRGEQQPPTTEARDRLEKVKAALAQAEGKAR